MIKNHSGKSYSGKSFLFKIISSKSFFPKLISGVLILTFALPLGSVQAAQDKPAPEPKPAPTKIDQIDLATVEPAVIPPPPGENNPGGNNPGGNPDNKPKDDLTRSKNDDGGGTDRPKKKEKEDPPKNFIQGEIINLVAQTTVGKNRQTTPSTDIDNITGALLYKYPIITPPGRNGVEPVLDLSYNSQDRDLSNLLGMGWSLNIPYIQRINKIGIQNIYSETYFSSSLDGELASTSATTFVPKVENGAFNSYEFSSNTWTVKDKSGTVYKFGTTTAARQDDPNNSNNVFKWMLHEVRDRNDNYIRYEYYKEDGQIYPSKIFYTGHANTDGIFEIEFVKQTRPDPMVSYAPRFEVKNEYRISEIKVKTNSQLSRKYALSYATTTHSVVSLLATSTEIGYDESDQPTTLANVEFDYQRSTVQWENESAAWNFPEDIVYDGTSSNWPGGTHVTDVNGDSWPDVVRSMNNIPEPDEDVSEVHLNTGSGWATSTSWTNPWAYVWNKYDAGTRLVDINGDLLPDVLKSHDDTNDISSVYTNNGSNWEENTSWTIPVFFVRNNGIDKGVRIADVNGDGLPDILKGLAGESFASYLNTGTGWTATTTWNPPAAFSSELYDYGGRMQDVNGDGLNDAVFCSFGEEVNKVFLNIGSGWSQTSYTIPNCFIDNNNHDSGGRLVDVDDDSLPDSVESGGGAFYNRGNGWATGDSVATGLLDVSGSGSDSGVRLADVNADGIEDQVRGNEGTRNVYIKQGNRNAVLSKITSSLGGTTTVQYKTSANYTTGGAFSNPSLPVLLETVNKISYGDVLTAPRTYEYSYEGGNYYYNGPFDRKFSGFNSITLTDPASNVTKTYFHQGSTTASSLGEYDDHISKVGKPYRVEVRDSSDNLYSLTVNKWDKESLGNGAYFVKLTQKTELSYDGDSDHKDKAATFGYDSHGNVTSQVDFGEVTGSTDGSYTDTGSDKFTTTVSYAASTTLNMYAPSEQTVENQSSATVRKSKFYYDSLAQGSIDKGRLTKQELWKSGSSYIDVEKTYNSYGLVTEEKDPRDKTTTYEYDSYNLYPATTTNPLSQKVAFVYDYSSGKPKQVKDPNEYIFQTVYDGLDRPIEEKQPDMDSPSTLVTKSTITYYDTGPLPRGFRKIDYLSSATSTDSYTYFDGFGRVVQQRTEAEDSDQFSVKDTKYNSIGKVYKESLPYFSSGASSTAATTNTDLYTTFLYDPLYRVTEIDNVAGETTNAYDQWKLTVTDANGEVKHLYKDAYDNLVKVEEINGANTYTTNYEYDGNKSLTKITDALSNIRNFTYDGLGRRLTAQDLHASADSYFGTWYYEYDAASNLASTTDPKGQNVQYTYDDLNRPTVENYVGIAGNEIEYGYDSCTGGIGRLCVATSTAVVISNEYNPLGGVKKESKKIGATTYATDYTHNRLGSPIYIENPDASTVSNTYNDAGLLEKINFYTAENNATTTVIKDLDYSPLGQFSFIQYGNNASTTNTFYTNELYRLQNKVTRFNSVDLQNLSYIYDSVGNITRITDISDTNSAKTVNYQYDDLHRLTRASSTYAVAGNFLETYTYNALGNITYKSDTANYTYDGNTGTSFANPHAPTYIWNTELKYDNSGNLTEYSPWKYEWNYRNEMTQAATGTATTTSTYDHTGERVTYVDSTGTTYYISPGYEISHGDIVRHVFAGNDLFVTIETVPDVEYIGGGGEDGLGGGEGGGATTDCCSVPVPYIDIFHYIHSDHISSTGATSDSAGALETLNDYYPYGEVRLDETSTTFKKRKFIGEVYDGDSKLSYLNARYLSGNQGQFLSQDPVFWAVGTPGLKQRTNLSLEQYLSDPQQMNSYAYGRNNPLKYKDSTGEFIDIFLDIGFIAYDTYRLVRAAATGGDVKSEVKSLALDIGGAALPGVTGLGMMARVAGKVDDVVDAGKVVANAAKTTAPNIANGLTLGEKIPSLGKIIENASGKINGFNHDGTFHGLDQVIDRGITPQTLLNTVKNPLVRFDGRFGRTGYLTRDAYVVLDKASQVVTGWTKNEFRGSIKRVLRKIR